MAPSLGSITGANSSTRMLLLLHRGGYAPPRGDAATTTGSALLVSLLLLGHVNRSKATFHRNHQPNRHVVKRIANWAREWKMSQNVSTGTDSKMMSGGPGEESMGCFWSFGYLQRLPILATINQSFTSRLQSARIASTGVQPKGSTRWRVTPFDCQKATCRVIIYNQAFKRTKLLCDGHDALSIRIFNCKVTLCCRYLPFNLPARWAFPYLGCRV